MILVEGEKYACVQCIRGHRSSTCQHTKRPLVQVRSRGRPNNGLDHRVTVFADEDTAKSQPKACCSSSSSLSSSLSVRKEEVSSNNATRESSPVKVKESCCGSLAAERQPVIMLKASRKQLYNVSKGSFSLLGPVSAPEMKLPQGKGKLHDGKCTRCQRHVTKTPKNPVRNRLSEVPMSLSQSSLVTSTEGSSRQSPSSSDGEFKVPKSEYLVRPIEGDINTMPSRIYDMFYTKACTITGSCCCEDTNCSCDGCSVHKSNAIQSNISDGQLPFQQAPLSNFSSHQFQPVLTAPHLNFVHQASTPSPSPQPTNSFDEMMKIFSNFNSIQQADTYDPLDDCSCVPQECACYNCPKHLIVDGIRLSDGVKVADDPFDQTTSSSTYASQLNVLVGSQNRATIQHLLFNEFFNEETLDMMEDCLCPLDNCNCLNCFKHGIFNNEVVNFESPALKLVPKSEDATFNNYNSQDSQ